VDFTLPRRPVSLSLVSGRGHYDSVITAVMAARTSVWIATANLKGLMVEGTRKTYRSILAVFDELARKKIELRILHAGVPSRVFRRELDERPRLTGGGLELRHCPRVHLKAVVVDGSLLYLGSANWTGAGLGAKGANRRNFELGVVTEDEQMLDQVQGLYDRIWRGRECKACRLREVCPGPLDAA
jgi:phosphatidylserine/phosphatidylglycerophosphate/cardiolipin synthase-like enzyme